MTEDISVHARFLREFAAAIRKVPLYPQGHPVIREALQRPFSTLQSLLSSGQEFTLSQKEDNLLVNGENLEDPASRLLVSDLKTLNVESITMKTGVSREELEKLFQSMSNPKETSAQGGLKAMLAGLAHITVDEVIYQKAREKAAPAPESAAVKAPAPARRPRAPRPAPAQRAVPSRSELTQENEALRQKLRELETSLDSRLEDLTGRLKQENARLAGEKERIDTIIRNVGEGLVVVDDTGKILLMNPAAEKLLGKSFKEASGKPLADNIREEHLLAISRGMPGETGDTATKEIEIVAPDDNTTRILRTSTAVVENKDGKTVGMVSVLSDITKQKELDKIKSDFVSNVSHELRTPLVVIKKNMELISSGKAGETTDDQKNFLSIALRNVSRLSKLIDDLLDMSRIEAGKLVLNKTGTDLRETVSSTVQALATWAAEKNITMRQDTPVSPVMVLADAERITQVAVNLIGNAIKFTPRGGEITVGIKARQDLPAELQDAAAARLPQAVVTVADTGIGIDETDQKRIFEKFEQVRLAQPQGMSATGLGLAISKEIVNMHGGKIWVDSQKGHGSTFSFSIPLEEAKNGQENTGTSR